MRSAEKGGASIDPHGFDAGKKIILVDPQGRLMQVIVHFADVQDRDGSVLLLLMLLDGPLAKALQSRINFRVRF